MKGKKAQPKQAEKSPEKEKSPQNKKEEQKKSSSNSKPKDNKDAKDNKDKTKNKGGKDPVPKLEKKEPQKPKYKLDFIYRREKYTLKNLAENFLVSKMKKLIAKEINVDIKALKFFYKEKASSVAADDASAEIRFNVRFVTEHYSRFSLDFPYPI